MQDTTGNVVWREIDIGSYAGPHDITGYRHSEDGNEDHANRNKLEFITPTGDPEGEPRQSGEGQNEFVYSSASPGVLTMNLKARVTPAEKAAAIKDNVRFLVEDIGDSEMSWHYDNPEGKPLVDGACLLATVWFETLPAENSTFGRKHATLRFNGCKIDEEAYEVFFPRDAANNPGGTTPNWYYYWDRGGVVSDLATVSYQALSIHGIHYQDLAFVCNGAPTTSTVEHVVNRDFPDLKFTIGVDADGIDCCAAVCAHEKEHVRQWTAWHETPADQDGDHDGIPDDVESSSDGPYALYKLSPYSADTYNCHHLTESDGDKEFLAHIAEQHPGAVSPDKDWSDTNGKHWKR